MVIQRYLVLRDPEQLLKAQQGGVYISPLTLPLLMDPSLPPRGQSEVQVKSEVQVRGMVKLKKFHGNMIRDLQGMILHINRAGYNILLCTYGLG